jgi:hypothetical protein
MVVLQLRHCSWLREDRQLAMLVKDWNFKFEAGISPNSGTLSITLPRLCMVLFTC